MNYTFNRQVLEPRDNMKPSASCAQPQKGNGGSSTRAQQTEGFCVSGGRPKHVSWLPQVGQNFKNRDTVMLAERLAGATPIFRGTGRIDKSGDFARSMSIRYGGVNPFLPFNG